MNLLDLFEVQRKLDAGIEAKHPVQVGEDRFSKKKLALLVEIGELANEQRSWKFWSKDKRPRTIYQTTCDPGVATHHYCEECKEDANNEDVGEHFRQCEGILYPMRAKNPLLEEYVDCIHFLLSIGNEYAKHAPNFHKGIDTYFEPAGEFNADDTARQFNAIFQQVSKFGGGHNEEFDWALDIPSYTHAFLLFIGLATMLGFTEGDVVDAYMSKNKTNWERQANGY